MASAPPASIGQVIQITGPVVDIEFPAGELPAILNAVEVDREGQEPLVCEVAQHLGNNWVRTVAMTTTDGLARGTRATDTGGPLAATAAAASCSGSKLLPTPGGDATCACHSPASASSP